MRGPCQISGHSWFPPLRAVIDMTILTGNPTTDIRFSNITVISSELMPQQTIVIGRDRDWFHQCYPQMERMYWLSQQGIQWEKAKPPMDPDLLVDEGL